MGQCGWRKELGLGVAAPQPPSYKLSLNTPFMHKHSPHWQRDAAAALRDPGKHDNSGVGKKSNRGMKRALCHFVGYFQRVALWFSQATSRLRGNLGGQVTTVKRTVTSSS